MPFPGQAEIRDLQYLVAQISIFHLFEYQYWRKGRGGLEIKGMQSKAIIYVKKDPRGDLPNFKILPDLYLFKHTTLCLKLFQADPFIWQVNSCLAINSKFYQNIKSQRTNR